MEMKSIADVVNNRPLEYGDIVVFEVNGKTLRYRVQGRYLNQSGGHNSQVFEELGLNKMAFVRPLYAEDAPRSGDSRAWPTVQSNDYESLTRVVCALYLAIEAQKKDVIEVIVNGKAVELSEESSAALIDALKS